VIAIERQIEKLPLGADRLQGRLANLLELALHPRRQARDKQLVFHIRTDQFECDPAAKDDALDPVSALECERENLIGLIDLARRGDHKSIDAATGA
jgi:hypothetical protein